MLKSKNILITGGIGFITSYLATTLKKNNVSFKAGNRMNDTFKTKNKKT